MGCQEQLLRLGHPRITRGAQEEHQRHARSNGWQLVDQHSLVVASHVLTTHLASQRKGTTYCGWQKKLETPPKSCKYQHTLLFQPWFQSGTTRFRHNPQLSRPSFLFPVRFMSSWLGPGSWVLMPWSKQRAWRTQGMKGAMRRLRSSQKSQRPRGKFSSRA